MVDVTFPFVILLGGLLVGIARHQYASLPEQHLREPRAVVAETRRTAPGVRKSEELERALQSSVFAAGAVKRDEYAVEMSRQLGQRLVPGIEAVRIDAALLQRGEAGRAGLQRNFALARGAAEQHGDAAEFRGGGRAARESRIVSEALRSAMFW